MSLHHITITKVLDGKMTLGRGNIIPESLTVDGGKVPKGMLVDYVKGDVCWADQSRLGPRGPYRFEFDYNPMVIEDQTSTEEKLIALVDKLVEKQVITTEDALVVKEVSAEAVK